jgi:putative nucleotidyltransferase with HDIG domain
MFDTIIIPKNLLLVDDNSEARTIFVNFFGAKYNCREADSLETALAVLREQEISVILCSFNLPKLSGLEILRCIQAQAPHSVVVLIGESLSADEVIKVFRGGAFDYIQQPYKLLEINNAVKKAFDQYELRCLKNNYQIHLEDLSSQRTTELDKAVEEVENSYRNTLKALVQALETRDSETYGHSERVVTFSLRLGHEVGLDKEGLKNLELGALLHDIGKIGVPDAILRKPSALNREEWDKMKLHPIHGQNILRHIAFLEAAGRIVAQHHEKWDGSGYPFELRGQEIDLGARIFAVVDAFDAMTSDRVYRRGCSYAAALEELEGCAGTHFDPAIVEAFKRVPREDWEVLRRRSLVQRQEVFSFQTLVAELVYSKHQFEMVH